LLTAIAMQDQKTQLQNKLMDGFTAAAQVMNTTVDKMDMNKLKNNDAALNAADVRGRRRKAVVDTVAAAIILQEYLDARRTGARGQANR